MRPAGAEAPITCMGHFTLRAMIGSLIVPVARTRSMEARVTIPTTILDTAARSVGRVLYIALEV